MLAFGGLESPSTTYDATGHHPVSDVERNVVGQTWFDFWVVSKKSYSNIVYIFVCKYTCNSKIRNKFMKMLYANFIPKSVSNFLS